MISSPRQRDLINKKMVARDGLSELWKPPDRLKPVEQQRAMDSCAAGTDCAAPIS